MGARALRRRHGPRLCADALPPSPARRAPQELFNIARQNAPAVVFIDEVDALAGSSDGDDSEAGRRFRAELLTQMDGIRSAGAPPSRALAPLSPQPPFLLCARTVRGGPSKGALDQRLVFTAGEGEMVIVLATTNRPWALDEAMRRRLEKRIYVPLPDEAARAVRPRHPSSPPHFLRPPCRAAHLPPRPAPQEVVRLQLRGVQVGPDVDPRWIASQTAGFSGAWRSLSLPGAPPGAGCRAPIGEPPRAETPSPLSLPVPRRGGPEGPLQGRVPHAHAEAPGDQDAGGDRRAQGQQGPPGQHDQGGLRGVAEADEAVGEPGGPAQI